MKKFCAIFLLGLLAACSTTSRPPIETQAVRDYIAVSELQEVERIRTFDNDTWTYLSDFFVVYKARNRVYLVEFRRPCRELRDTTRVLPDYRHDQSGMHKGVDTLRGCRIDKMYPLTKGQAAELRNLGDAPGEGN